MYEAVFPELKGKTAYLVTMEEEGGEPADFIVTLVQDGGELVAAPVMTECLISYLPCAPTQLVEYRFSKVYVHPCGADPCGADPFPPSPHSCAPLSSQTLV